jgi:hypothetical protein
MTRAEAEAQITNLKRSRNLLILARDSYDAATVDVQATLGLNNEEVTNLTARDLLRLVERALRVQKEVGYDDAKTNGQI